MIDTFPEWAESYAGIFGLTSREDRMMVQAWEEVFYHAGYTVSELDSAKNYLSKYGGIIKREEHLTAIQTYIQDERKRAYAKDRERVEKDQGTCVHCGNTGWVAVPHPKQVRDGQWIGTATATVTCSCLKGRRVHQSHCTPPEERKPWLRDLPTPMTFEFYEANNPQWFQQMEARRQELAARAHAQNVAEETSGRKRKGRAMPKSWEGKVQA